MNVFMKLCTENIDKQYFIKFMVLLVQWLFVLCCLAWDNDDIDHWHIEKFNEDDMPQPLTEESSFATLFPKYREKYLQKVWPHVTRVLKSRVIQGGREPSTHTHTHMHTHTQKMRPP